MCGHFLYVNGDHSMLQSNIDRPIRHEKIDVFLRIPLTSDHVSRGRICENFSGFQRV